MAEEGSLLLPEEVLDSDVSHDGDIKNPLKRTVSDLYEPTTYQHHADKQTKIEASHLQSISAME